MTPQETFTIVARHLLKQNQKSMITDIPLTGFLANTPHQTCAYRSPDGLKCAIGCLIPDDRYSETFERYAVASCGPLQHILKELGHDLTLCERLQAVHDRFDPYQWHAALCRVAADFQLVMPTDEEVPQ